MRLARTADSDARNSWLQFPATDNFDIATALLRPHKVHTGTRVFCLTILFVDSIQRTNCDDVMSQCSMKNGKGRIEMATKKAAKKATKKAAKKKKH
jgi:hypothetical protein